jgi:hypothetical protein
MGLLKTVFEVNLGLFGKKSQERCVRFAQPQRHPLIDHVAVQTNAHFSYLLFAITSEQRLSQTSRQR